MATHNIKTQAELEEILDSNDTVVLDFWAKWCPPCRGFAPVFESVASRNTDMAFCRVNTEEAKELKDAFEISSIPTLAVIKERVLVLSHSGYMDKHALADALDQVRSLDVDQLRQEASAGDN